MQWIPGQRLEYVEQIAIQEAYQFYRGNKTQTAASLGISINTLNTKLEKYLADERDRKLAQERYREQQDEFTRRARATAAQFVIGSNVPSPHARPSEGFHVESFAQIPSEQSMSMSERPQVQKVLSNKAPGSSDKRSR